MAIKLFFYRKFKTLFIKFRLHGIVGILSDPLLNLVYLSKISKWIHVHRTRLEFNDFYSKKWDYNKRYGLYKYVMNKENLSGPITYLEFGVAGGYSFKWWTEHNRHYDSRFYGFDTFEGLPDDWGLFKAGDMSTHSLAPDIDDPRVRFVKGLFQETLPGFLNAMHRTGRWVIHMDADLYSSTLYVLTRLSDHLESGDIVFFDEFLVPQHEFLAFSNYVQSYHKQFELIGAANNFYFVAFRMK